MIVAAAVVEEVEVFAAAPGSSTKLASCTPVCRVVVFDAVASVRGESTGSDCSSREAVFGENGRSACGSAPAVPARCDLFEPTPAPLPPPTLEATPSPELAPPPPLPPDILRECTDRGEEGLPLRGDEGLPLRAAADAGGSFGMTRRRPPDLGDDTAGACPIGDTARAAGDCVRAAGDCVRAAGGCVRAMPRSLLSLLLRRVRKRDCRCIWVWVTPLSSSSSPRATGGRRMSASSIGGE